MDRPTRERVEEILEYAKSDRPGSSRGLLAAEVRALRAELERGRAYLLQLEADTHSARSARAHLVALRANVAALVNAARVALRTLEEDGYPLTAGDLEEALKPFEDVP